MGTKILNRLFVAIIVLIMVLLIAIIPINIFEEEESNVGGLNDITGAMQSFEVSHGKTNFYQPTKRVSERYDDKYFEYLESIQKSGDKTFMRGKVFLREK